MPRETHQVFQGPCGNPLHPPPSPQVHLPRPKEPGGKILKDSRQSLKVQRPLPGSPVRSEAGVGFQPCDPGVVHISDLLFLWCLASRVMCRCSPGQVSACVRMPPPPSPPFAFSLSLFSGPTVLMAGQHLFSLSSPPQNNGGRVGSPPCLSEGLCPGLEVGLPLEVQLVPGWLFLRRIFSTCQTWDF